MQNHSHNPWHDLSFGEEAPQVVTAVIEIPNRSIAKYELHKDSGMLMLDRVLSGPNFYPANYGFIPQTYCDDKDPLDILVISQVDIQPLCIVEARVIGAMKMIDGGEMDDKIIAVAAGDKFYDHVTELEHLPKNQLEQIKHFFEDYKFLEKKTVEVKEFENRQTALKIVEESIELYKQEFGN